MRATTLKQDTFVSLLLMLALMCSGGIAAVTLVDGSLMATGMLVFLLVLGIVFARVSASRIAASHAPDQEQLAAIAQAAHASPDLDSMMYLAAQGVEYGKAFRFSAAAQLLVDAQGRVRHASAGFGDMAADHGPWLANTYPGFACEDPLGMAINSYIGEAGLNPSAQSRLVLTGRDNTVIDVLLSPIVTLADQRCWLVEFTPRAAPQACLASAIEAVIGNSLTQEHMRGMSDAQKAAILALRDEMHGGRDMAEETASVIAALADGNLTARVNRRGGGQTISTLTSVNTAIDRLANILRTLREGAEKIGGSTVDVSNSARVLAERTVQQAQSIVQTSTAMGQIAHAAQSACEHADRASKLASSARDSAASGGTIVANAIDAMGKIEESSSRITHIVGLIDDIAFQTNLLALNAAVEAARAGEAGKGFAVVATEVRSLAQRTGQASREIKDLIANSRNSVTTGVNLVRATDEELSRIEEVINELDQVMTKVAVASRQQAAGISEVADAIAQMDQITQQNATLVDKTMLALDGTHKQIHAFQSIMRNGEPVPAAAAMPSGQSPRPPAAPPLAAGSRSSFSSMPARSPSSTAGGTSRNDARRMQDSLQDSFKGSRGLNDGSGRATGKEPMSAPVARYDAPKHSAPPAQDQYGTAARALLMHDDEWNEF